MTEERCSACFNPLSGTVCSCGYPERGQNANHQLPIGTMLRKRYQVGRVLGQGGYGITYLCWDTLLQKPVAVKEFFPEGTVYRKSETSTALECVTERVTPHFEYTRERFLREASALVRFQDIPEVVSIHDFVEENNTAYIVMEYVRGVDLAKYIHMRGGKLSVEETFLILKPVMEALAKVHRGGIIHRDISPDNIILDPMGGAKLLDFGAVRTVEDPSVDKGLNKSTEAILKHGFAPIEQYNTRGSLGPWTDEYAMCATVWYCLTGKIPEEASIRISEGIDPDWSMIPGLPEHQQKALAKGFSCRAKDRYKDLDDLLADLFPALGTVAMPIPPVQYMPEPAPQPVPQPIPQPVSQAKKKSRGKWKFFLGIGLGVAAVAAAVAILILTAPARKYHTASSLLDNGRYEEAIEKFSELGSYSNSRSMIKVCNYAWATQLMEDGAYQEAADRFTDLKNYEDSRDMAMECHYRWAEDLLQAGHIQEAIDKFTGLGNYKDSTVRVLDCLYVRAEMLLEEGRLMDAALAFGELDDHSDARERSIQLWSQLTPQHIITAGDGFTLALRTDGTVAATGNNEDGQCDVSGWTNIVAIFAGDDFSLGLRSDGTVVATGNNEDGQCNVSDWTDIVTIATGYRHTVALKRDGTVLTLDDGFTNSYYKGVRSDARKWTDIVAVCAGGGHTVGLKSDGTVVAVGYNERGECEVGGWSDIVAISTGTWHTIGLKSDGTVVAVGNNTSDQCEVEDWTDIVAICAGKEHTVGLKADGTVVAVGDNANGQCDVSGWTDIVAICAGEYHTVGLKADGSLVAVGKNSDGQCDVSHWTGIWVSKE